jgi:glutamate N-acetyltransferase / amino-acid N-acetyltransferase
MCRGFKAAGIRAGLKKNKDRDLGLIYSRLPAAVAGVFTKNRVQAAPVILDRERIQSGTTQAIVVNSGNANCCTGPQGMADAKAMAGAAAACLGISEDMVLVASTGVIGQPLPIKKIESAMPELVRSLSEAGFSDFARAIMTTDTMPKRVSRTGEIEGKQFTVTGIAKGAGMIRPDLATMLCFVCTDIGADPQTLHQTLIASVNQSFNRITIDGDTSTNDTVLLLANGAAGVTVAHAVQEQAFQKTLDAVLAELAAMIVKDAEGATKLVDIVVKGAASNDQAMKLARTVAESSLVKCALFGEDANWGRIMAALGRAGVPIDPYRINILFDDVMMVKDGMGCGDAAEAEAFKVLKKNAFAITIEVNAGSGSGSVRTCDFSIDYVKINADYRS